jgi:hypothetical protein
MIVPDSRMPDRLFAPEPVKRCARGCTHKNLCEWAADREHTGIAGKQPRTCLLRHDPATAPLPEGY